MGKIIKDGFSFMAYANAGLIRKIDDVPARKNELIALSETKTHMEMSQYALLLAQHILTFSGAARTALIEECFVVNRKWQNGEINFRVALETAGALNDAARREKDPVTAKVLRAMGQVAATPHVRWHPLVASEYAVVVLNLLYPQNMDKVEEEREVQIGLMKSL